MRLEQMLKELGEQVDDVNSSRTDCNLNSELTQEEKAWEYGEFDLAQPD